MQIADFGLAQWVGLDGCTCTSKITNNLWVAPEVLNSDPCHKQYKVSRAADVYAFGAVMWEVLTGTMPHVNSDMTPREVTLVRFDRVTDHVQLRMYDVVARPAVARHH